MHSVKSEEERLQMFFDGELAPEEEEALRRDLENSPEQAANLADMEAIRAAIQAASEQQAANFDSGALFARIEKELAEPAASEPREPAKHAKPRLQLIRGVRKPRAGRGLAIGFAAAAALLLVVLARPANGPPGVTEPGLTTRGSEIVEIDFGSNTGTVFAVEGRAGQPVAVVWINDEEVGFP